MFVSPCVASPLKCPSPLHLIGTRSYRTYKYQNTHLDAAAFINRPFILIPNIRCSRSLFT